jgi:hypothetical protein
LEVLEGAYGPLDRRVVIALLNTAYYWNRIDVERALELKQDLLDRRMRIWGDRANAAVAIAEKELAFTLMRMPAQDRLEEAAARASHALSTLVTARGAYHHHTMMARGVWCFTSSRLSDQVETEGDGARAESLRREALALALDNLAHTPSAARLSTQMLRRRRVAELQVRLRDSQGLESLREVLRAETKDRVGDLQGDFDFEALWTVAELVAGLWRLGREGEALSLAAQYPIEREDRWPAFQPRGWRSTRPEDARAGVL